MAFFNAEHEHHRRFFKERKQDIIRIACLTGRFEASLRYRDHWLRKRCVELCKAKLLRKERGTHNGKLIYTPTKRATGEDLV